MVKWCVSARTSPLEINVLPTNANRFRLPSNDLATHPLYSPFIGSTHALGSVHINAEKRKADLTDIRNAVSQVKGQSVAEQKPQQNDHRDRHTHQPKQNSSSHRLLLHPRLGRQRMAEAPVPLPEAVLVLFSAQFNRLQIYLFGRSDAA